MDMININSGLCVPTAQSDKMAGTLYSACPGIHNAEGWLWSAIRPRILNIVTVRILATRRDSVANVSRTIVKMASFRLAISPTARRKRMIAALNFT